MPFNDFLKAEYAQSVDLIKYYDSRHSELLKFAVGLSTAVPTAVLAFRAATPTEDTAIWKFASVTALITGLSLLTIFAALVQNRLYFVYPARQANGIRAAMFSGETIKNHMYTQVDVAAWKLLSTQTLLYTFVALQIGFFFGVAAYGLYTNPVQAAVVSLLVPVVLMVAAGAYLTSRQRRSSDEAVHGS